MNVVLIHGTHRADIEIIDSKESIEIEITELWKASVERVLRVTERIVGMVKQQTYELEEDYKVGLDPSLIENGLGLKIEYHNVAMIQYHTTMFIRHAGVVIESSWLMTSTST